jgi:mannose-6-phosphate isomerase-like protein (cupin superfamily)
MSLGRTREPSENGSEVTLFHRANLGATVVTPVCAHDGIGEISFARLLTNSDVAGAVNFIDLATLPPGSSIGDHRHQSDEEEYYLVLAGQGTMSQDGETFAVTEGDLIRNPPGASHGLLNDGTVDLRLFVFEVRVPA